jgi:nitrous oxidase accessory protein
VVLPGVYRERVVLDRSLALVGRPGAVVDGGAAGTVIRVEAPGVRVEGLVVRGSGRALETDDAGILVTAAGAVVRDAVLEAVLHGVYLRGADGARVERLAIRGGAARSLSTRGDGVRIWDGRGNVVADNDIRDVRDGIYIQAADGNRIERNAVGGSRYGLHYMYAGENVFAGNLFQANQVGASVMMSRAITLKDNTFAYNAGYVGYGVLLQDAQDVRVEGNRFVGNATGLFMDLAVRGRVTGNLFAGHQVGIRLYPSSEDNVFAGNVFLSNVADASTDRGGGTNRWAEAGAGNFWAAAGAYDLDGDGIGDVPHRTGSLLAHLSERYPQMRLFLFSPAMRALDLAERAVPVARVPEVVDPRPLGRRPPAAVAAPLPARGERGGLGLLVTGGLLAAVGGAGLALGARRQGGRR